MTNSAEALLKKAVRAVHAAKAQMESGDLDFAISRAYYAMFYATEAILVTEKGFSFENIAGFTRHLVNILSKPEKFMKNTIVGC